MLRRVPRSISCIGEAWGDDEIEFDASVAWLFQANECNRYKKWDKRVLKHALLVLDAEASKLEEAEST